MATRTKELLNLPPTVRDFLGSVIWGYVDGAPTDGVTGAGEAPAGCLLFDRVGKEVYKNTGTLASPTWNPLAGVIAGEITLATGSILVGAAGVGSALSAKTSGRILVGDGTTIASVAVSGDVALAANGATTIQAGAVDPAMLADGALSADATGRAKMADAFFDAATALAKFGTDSFDATTVADVIAPKALTLDLIGLAEGVILIGDSGAGGVALDIGATDTGIAIGNGTTATIAALSGDVTMANTGAVTIGAKKVLNTMVAMAEGVVFVGDAGGAAVALDIGNTDAGIAIGNGTTATIAALSGDVTMANTGAVTIGADKVTEQKMLVTLPVALSIPSTLAVRGGSGTDGVMVGLVTDTDSADVTQEDNSAATFVDETADAASAAANDVAIPDPFDTSDALYIGYTAKFFAVKIDMGTAGAGDAVAGETVWEYYNGAAWAALTEVIDDTGQLTTGTATYLVSFLPPANWATVAVDGGTAMYFVRFRATALDVYNTTQPLITQIWVKPLTVGQGVPVPFDGTITAVAMTALTASATNNDTELLVINLTAGTFAQVTWTGGDAMDRVTGLTLACTAGDNLAVAVINEDGTTEFASVCLYLEVSVG